MKQRVRTWLAETHGERFELFRHFLAQFFESDPAGSGGWLKLALGIAGLLPITWPILYLDLQSKYITLMQRPSVAAYRAMVSLDQLWLLSAAMCLTAILTSVQWQALFPGRRDLLALNSLPLGRGGIFLAKFASLATVFGAFVLALTLMPAYAFADITAGRWQANHSAMANTVGLAVAGITACGFVFFGIVGMQGILLNLLPARWFARLSVYAQGLLFTASLAAVPHIGQLRPQWFVDVWAAITGVPGASAAPALIALGSALATAIATYLLAYRRYQRVLLEERSAAPRPHRVRWAAKAMDWWIRDPREQAMFVFLWKTLARSRQHRLLLLAYTGVAIGWVLHDTSAWSGPQTTRESMAVVLLWTALTVSTFVMAGLRYLMTMPVEIGANWAFQLTEREGRAAWLSALERFVIWCGVGPVLLAGLPAVAAEAGWLRAMGSLALALLFELIVFDLLFQAWKKAPFACTHTAARKPLLVALIPYAFVLFGLAPASLAILYSTGYLPLYAAVAGLLAAIWLRVRRERLRLWAGVELMYQDESDELTLLGLGPRGALRSEESAGGSREVGPVAPAAIFTGTLAGTLARHGAGRLADVEAILRERERPGSIRSWVRMLWEDCRFGIRLARRNPSVSAVVVLTLALGIAMNATVFTVLSNIALRPQVYRDPGSFAMVFPLDVSSGAAMPASYEEYLAFAGAQSLRSLAASSRSEVSLGESRGGGSPAQLVSCNFFAMEGLARARLGRLLEPADCAAPGEATVALLSEQTWRERFAGDPGILGRAIHVDGLPFTVVGIVPADAASWDEQAAVWLPFTAQPQLDPSTSNFAPGAGRWLRLSGRLAAGHSRAQAQAELSTIAQRLRLGRRTAAVVSDGSWIDSPGFTARTFWLMTLAMAGLTMVLLISCANVATLLLSRAVERQREVAVRLSFGAPRSRILRMLLIESLLLAAAAGAIALYATSRAPDWLYAFLVKRPPSFHMAPDWRVFVYAAVVVLAMGLLAGLAPALESLRADLAESLKGHGPLSFGGPGGGRIRSFLVSAQVALSLALLVCAGGFGRSQFKMFHGDPGYETRHVLTVPVHFPPRTRVDDAAQFRRDLAARVEALPGVRAWSYTNSLSIAGYQTVELRLPGRPGVYTVAFNSASPRYFETLNIPIVRGREFQQSDLPPRRTGGEERAAAPAAPTVLRVVVSTTFAQKFWPGQDAVGKRLEMDRAALEVVGVARDINRSSFGGSEFPAAWWLAQEYVRNSILLVRVEGPAPQAAAAIRALVAKMAPDMAAEPRPLQASIDEVAENVWNVVALVGVLGAVAMVLAVTGIYGAVRFAAEQRNREMGIRVALGAQHRDIVREVLVAGGKPVISGMLAGLWLALLLAAALREALASAAVRLDASDPLVYSAAALFLAFAALLAMLGPARKSARRDPLKALRAD